MTNDPAKLESMLDTLARTGESAGEPPAAFIGRVRRRRLVRRATRAGAGVLVMTVVAGVFFVSRPGDGGAPLTRPDTTPMFATIEWPPLPDGLTGGPVAPIRAGIRPTDPMAVALLQ